MVNKLGEVNVVSVVGCDSLLQGVDSAFGKEEIVDAELKWREAPQFKY